MAQEKQASEPEVSEVVVSGTRATKIDWTVKPQVTSAKPDFNDLSNVKPIDVTQPLDPNVPFHPNHNDQKTGLYEALKDFRRFDDNEPAYSPSENGVSVGITTKGRIGFGFTWGASPAPKDPTKMPDSKPRRSPFER